MGDCGMTVAASFGKMGHEKPFIAAVAAWATGGTEVEGPNWGLGAENSWAVAPRPGRFMWLEDHAFPLPASNIIACACN
jgi:hypothetical protein